MNPKFKVGDLIQEVSNENETGNIISISWNSDQGFGYIVSSKEVDTIKKEVIEGIKTYKEDEIELAKEKDEISNQ